MRLTLQGGRSSPVSALQRAPLVAVGAGPSAAFQNLKVWEAFGVGLVRVTPVWVIFCSGQKPSPAGGRCLRRRRMRDRAVQGNDRRKSLLLGSPHPSRLRRATFPQGGKAFRRKGPHNHQGSAPKRGNRGNCHPLAASEQPEPRQNIRIFSIRK